jgi:hypothetical protein
LLHPLVLKAILSVIFGADNSTHCKKNWRTKPT